MLKRPLEKTYCLDLEKEKLFPIKNKETSILCLVFYANAPIWSFPSRLLRNSVVGKAEFGTARNLEARISS